MEVRVGEEAGVQLLQVEGMRRTRQVGAGQVRVGMHAGKARPLKVLP